LSFFTDRRAHRQKFSNTQPFPISEGKGNNVNIDVVCYMVGLHACSYL